MLTLDDVEGAQDSVARGLTSVLNDSPQTSLVTTLFDEDDPEPWRRGRGDTLTRHEKGLPFFRDYPVARTIVASATDP